MFPLVEIVYLVDVLLYNSEKDFKVVDMAVNSHSLRVLEGLMTEFFDVRTTNDKKRHIEELLNNFSREKDAWKHCLYFLSSTQNEYVMMYCMTVLENLINKQWVGLLGMDRMEIRSTLYKFLLDHHKEFASFIRNKLVKLVVDIGRLDWPHFYPDFFANNLHLIQQQETVALGLVMLQTTSEELISPREDLSVSRKEELHRLLLEQVPTVLNLLTGILESVLDKQRHLVTATPPPSPTHGQSESSHCLFSTSPLQTGSLLSSIFKSLSNKNPFHTLPPLDPESHYLCTLALNCLSHLFGWIPLSTHITPNLLNIIFHYASLGCDPTHHQNMPEQNKQPHHSQTSSLTMTSSTSMDHCFGNTRGYSVGMSSSSGPSHQQHHQQQQCSFHCSPSLAVLAMGCVNEIIAKNCVPADFEDFLLQMFQNAFHLLQRMVKDGNSNNSSITSAGNNWLGNIDESYMEKFTEFLRLFVGIHFRRFEANIQFPVLEFLALLFKYTFQQPTVEGFYACLEIWNVFLDHLIHKVNTGKDGQATIERYKTALLSLISQLQRKSQFKYNQAQLEELDDEVLDDDQETERQHFLRQCLEVVAKVAEMAPEDTCRILYAPFQEGLETYFGLEKFLVTDGTSRRLNVTAENECPRLHCVLRDLSSLLQAFGVLAGHFTGDAFIPWYSQTRDIVERVCQMAQYGSRVCLFNVSTAVPNVLRSDFIEVHAQTMATLKAFTHWINQLYTEAPKEGPEKALVLQLVSVMTVAALLMINKHIPDKILMASAQFLNHLTFTVRPTNLLEIPAVQEMYNGIGQGRLELLNMEAKLLMYGALNNVLLLPWKTTSDSDQQWALRSQHHARLIQSLTSSYRQIRHALGFAERKDLQEQAKPVITKTLQILQYLTENLQGESNKSKLIFYQNTQESIQATLPLLGIFLSQPDVSELMLKFFLTLFQVLRVQMGVPFAEQVIRTFLGLFTREQLAETILQENSMGCKIVERFLRILQLIIQEPGTAFKTFLPSTINLCMEHIYPLLAERSCPDVKLSLFELLYQILLNNWRYFFKSGLLNNLGQIGNDQIENESHFISIMQAFGQSLLQPDITIFRQNLEALESLNSKWKLYHRSIFKEMMLFQFLNVLFQVLIHKSHDLLQEDIAVTIYNMAAVDFDAFYSTFLPQFLQSCQGVDDTQKALLSHNFKLELDLPSFTHNIHRLVNDLRYYRLCNNSLTTNFVHF